MHALHRRLVLALAAASTFAAAVRAAELTVEGHVLVGRGLTLSAPPDPTRFRVVAGPRDEVAGFAAAGAPFDVPAVLREPLPGRGALLFWFKTPAPYESGRASETFTEKLLTLPGAAVVSLVVEKTSVTLLVEWVGRPEDVFERHIRVILPRLPGPAWHHLAVQWDGATGEANAFLNGTPYYVPGERTAPFPIGTAHEIVAYVGQMALADLRVHAAPFDAADLPAIVGPRFGTLADLLGARPLPALNWEGRRGALLYERCFATEDDGRDWILEGPGLLEWRRDGLQITSRLPAGPQGHLVYWCREIFPARFAAEWEFELLAPKGLCIVFFAARGRNGHDLFDPALAKRAGVFTDYTDGDIDAYHISYFANTPAVPRAVANLRKNHGFFLLSNGPIGIASVRAGETHRALLVKDGARIQMSIDGRTIINYTDDGRRAGPVLTEGRIGLRQMQWTEARYRNFRVYALK